MQSRDRPFATIDSLPVQKAAIAPLERIVDYDRRFAAELSYQRVAHGARWTGAVLARAQQSTFQTTQQTNWATLARARQQIF
ncbi:MAG: hypothetical protein WKF37_24510 [Bryobacteraceae bacterium]